MEKRAEKRRIVLVPLPLQGHITPMMQLGQALNSKGFSITVAQGDLNRVISSQHFPGFQSVIIPDSLPVSEIKASGPVEFMRKLNKTSKAGFKDCISQLLVNQGNDIACIIYDELMYCCGDAATELKLPSLIFSTGSATHKVCCSVLSKLNAKKFLIDMEDPELQNMVVENLHPISYKDLPIAGFGPLEPLVELCREVLTKRTASAVIINTVSYLESSSLARLQQELEIPVFPLGPLHITVSTATSLEEEDRSCIEWLNKQNPSSVIYISSGSLFHMETEEMLEMAWGLLNSNQPFLWVNRPGSNLGSHGTESLPEEISKLILEKGYIVKWAPQKEVLAHPAIGGFWSHCGWNSILESIGEGVPMICKPFSGDQKGNARYLECVWKIGIQVEGELDRGVVERAVKRLMVEEEGEEMRKRAVSLKEKLRASVRSGGSSLNSLEEVVNFMKTVKEIRISLYLLHTTSGNKKNKKRRLLLLEAHWYA